MIWVFTIVKDNLVANQFIIDRLPDYDTYKKKLNSDKLIDDNFEGEYFKPWITALRKISNNLKPNDIPHCSFRKDDKLFVCMGYQGFS